MRPREIGHFDFAQVVKRVADKMIQRHPHVFSTMQLESSEEVMNHWESFKRKEGKNSVVRDTVHVAGLDES